VKTGTFLQGMTALIILTATTPGLALPVPLDVTSANNGITDLFSTTFDGSQFPCSGASPPYCTFFGGEPGSPARNIVITPNPTRVSNAVPIGITPVPASGSFLNLTLNGARTQLTIAGGTIAVPPINLTIQGGTPNSTVVSTSGAGIVFDVAPQVATVDANGRAEFLVDLAPATAVDFSRFTDVAFPPAGSCAGPLCSLIPILTLDMVRYRLVIDYDATFSSFTGTYIGQTANRSLLSITMDSTPPGSNDDFTFSVPAGTAVVVPVGANDTGFTDPVTVTVTTPPTKGTITAISAPGPTTGMTVTYTANAGALGADSFVYQMVDSTPFSDSATVSINITQALDISVTDSTVPQDDQIVPFGNVTEGTTRDQTVTVTNSGNAALTLGTIGGLNPLAAPFSIVTNNCSGVNATLAPAASCTVLLRYRPAGVGTDDSDSFDIPSNDPDEASVVVSLTGSGIALGEGGVETPTPSGADSGFMAIDPATVLLLGAAGIWGWRRRRT
jgi:MYXO-CTERM domain-containing protein